MYLLKGKVKAEVKLIQLLTLNYMYRGVTGLLWQGCQAELLSRVLLC